MNATALMPSRKIAKAVTLHASSVKALSPSENEAVATKPRSKTSAKVSSAKPLFVATETEQAMRDIIAMLNKVEELADTAGQLRDPDDTVNRILDVAINDVMTELFEQLCPDAFSEGTVYAALDKSYTLQALLQGAEAVDHIDRRGALISEAVSILDTLSVHIDRVDFWPREEAAPKNDVGPAINALVRSRPDGFDPYCAMLQAIDVTDVLGDRADSALLWGIHNFTCHTAEVVRQAQDALNGGTYSGPLHETASEELEGLLAVIIHTNGQLDESLLYAVETLVAVAKAAIDMRLANHTAGDTQ